LNKTSLQIDRVRRDYNRRKQVQHDHGKVLLTGHNYASSSALEKETMAAGGTRRRSANNKQGGHDVTPEEDNHREDRWSNNVQGGVH
jgi:hypothetical protein